MKKMSRLFKLLNLSSEATINLTDNPTKNNADKCERLTQITIDELNKMIKDERNRKNSN